MDDVERGQEKEQALREAALERRRPTAPPACGVCLYCNEPVPGVRRWCNEDCRDDWEREQGR